MIDSEDTTEDPFTLKIHEIIPGLLIRGPSRGALEKLERSKSVSKLYTLHLERGDGFRSVGTSGGRRDFIKKRGEDGFGVERDPNSYGGS